MITLIIDTSTDKSLVAFAEGTDLLLTIFLPAGTQSSRTLMSTIEKGCKQLNLNNNCLKALAVGVGPGSYTGIRVGVAAAYGLAFPKEVPLIGFCTLEGYVSDAQGPFASLIDARMGGSYVLLQERVDDQVRLISLPQLIPKEELENYLSSFPTQVGPHVGYPNPQHLAYLAARKLEREHASHLDIIYLRTPEYQVQII